MKMPIDRFFNLVFFWATDGAEQAEIDKYVARLNMPDAKARRRAKTAVTGPWTPKAEADALGGLAAALGGGFG